MHTTDKQTRNDQSKPERILDAVLVAIVVLPYSEAERSAYFFLPRWTFLFSCWVGWNDCFVLHQFVSFIYFYIFYALFASWRMLFLSLMVLKANCLTFSHLPCFATIVGHSGWAHPRRRNILSALFRFESFGLLARTRQVIKQNKQCFNRLINQLTL